MRVEAANTGRPGVGPGSAGGPRPPSNARQGLWQGRRASLFSAGRIALTRIGGGWRLLIGVGIGILVAVVLITTVPLYDTLMTNVQLQATLAGQNGPQRNVEIIANTSSFSASLSASADSRVRADGAHYLGGFTAAQPTAYFEADDMLLAKVGSTSYNLAAVAAPEVKFLAYDYASTASHMRLIAGNLPQAGSSTPQAIITQQMAQAANISIGTTVRAVQFGAHDQGIAVQVVGIWTPTNAADPYWNGRSFDAGGSDIPPAPSIYPVLMTAQDFTAVTSAVQGLTVYQHWVYYTDPARISTSTTASVQSDVGQLRGRLLSDLIALGEQVVVATSLDKTIAAVRQQLSLLTLPLYVVVAQIVGLALLFVLAMAGLLVDGQTVEIATLKSRGASAMQLLGSFAFQGVLLGIVAVLLGPWLAGLLAVTLVERFVPAATLTTAGASSTYLLGLVSTQAVVLPAIAGGLLGVGAVIVATQQAARMDVLAFRREQGRATRVPLWRRYYLDVALVVLCAIGFYELRSYGSLGTRVQLGQSGTNPFLLAAPALLLLAGSLLLLRLFPLAATLGARWASRARGATEMLAFAQLERSPAGPSRLMLLLALAVGLGLFALTFDASLARNTADRAAYQVGADVRVVDTGFETAQQDAARLRVLEGLPNVQNVTSVYRGAADTTFQESYTHVSVLGVDPTTWGAAAGQTSWRSDYASSSLVSLMSGLQSHQIGAIGPDRAGQTQAGTPAHAVWAIVSQTFASQLNLKVGDHFQLDMPGTGGQDSNFTVGGIVSDFPTLYPTEQLGGFVVLNINDTIGAIAVASQGLTTVYGSDEYWIHTTDPAATVRAVEKYASDWQVTQVLDRSVVEASIAGNPLEAGMRGLLLVGAFTAAALAVLGTVVQSALAARQRVVQFAVLRTMGMTSGQLSRLLLSEQVIVYVVGLIGGTALGAVLASATLPFLQFGDSSLDPTTLGVPPYVLALDPVMVLVFYVVLVLAFVAALYVAARFAARVGLGKTLRLGED
jgi:ABC-type lipoprotein release transport system permease subunit